MFPLSQPLLIALSHYYNNRTSSSFGMEWKLITYVGAVEAINSAFSVTFCGGNSTLLQPSSVSAVTQYTAVTAESGPNVPLVEGGGRCNPFWFPECSLLPQTRSAITSPTDDCKVFCRESYCCNVKKIRTWNICSKQLRRNAIHRNVTITPRRDSVNNVLP